MVPPSVRWGYFRIMVGTILGGALGFYVMHRVDTSYKRRMEERAQRYYEEMKRKEAQQQQQQQQDNIISES